MIAVGTTTVRTLEFAVVGGRLMAISGPTSLYILPGYAFRVVDAMITNFHLPKSTLIMLVSAFAGRERLLNAYEGSETGRLPVLFVWGRDAGQRVNGCQRIVNGSTDLCDN